MKFTKLIANVKETGTGIANGTMNERIRKVNTATLCPQTQNPAELTHSCSQEASNAKPLLQGLCYNTFPFLRLCMFSHIAPELGLNL